MEPVTVLAVVGNAIQLAEVGISVVSKSNAIYNSGTGTLAENDSIECVTQDLASLTAKLSASITQASLPTAHTEDDKAVLDICAACSTIATNLLQALDKLKSKGDLTRWKSLRSALKSVWRKEKINALEVKLGKYRSELNSRLLWRLRTDFNLAELQRTADFARLDDALKLLVNDLATQAKAIESAVDKQGLSLQRSIACASQSLEVVVLASADATAVTHEQSHVEVIGRIDRLQTASAQQTDVIVDVRADIVSALGDSVAASTLDHQDTRAQLSSKYRDVEKQVEELRQELREIKAELISVIQKAVQYGGKRGRSKKQRFLKEKANLLHKLWVAKELILQKTLEFLSMLHARISGSAWTQQVSFSFWKLQAYRTPVRSTNKHTPNAASSHGDGDSEFQRLMLAIEQGNLEVTQELRQNSAPPMDLNQLSAWTIECDSLNDDEIRFYNTILDLKVHHDQTGRGEIEMAITPLILAVIKCHKGNSDIDKRKAIVSYLLNDGADPIMADGAGLTAHDHALILQLDDALVHRLDTSTRVRKLLEDLHDPDTPKSLFLAWTRGLSASKYDDAALLAQCIYARWRPEYFAPGATPFDTTNYAERVFPSPILRLAFKSNLQDDELSRQALQTLFTLIAKPLVDHSPSLCSSLPPVLSAIFLHPELRDLFKQQFDLVSSGITYTDYQDALAITIVLDRLDMANHYLGTIRSYNLHENGTINWALYVAIRLGRFSFVELLSKWLPQLDEGSPYSQMCCCAKILAPPTTHMKSAFSWWWPLPCGCAKYTHSLRKRPLRKYVKGLATNPLCAQCEKLRPTYAQIDQYLWANIGARKCHYCRLAVVGPIRPGQVSKYMPALQSRA